MEVARLQVAFEATGQQSVGRALDQTEGKIKRLADTSEGSARRMGNAFAGAGKLVALGFGAVAAVGVGKAAAGFLALNANAEQYRIQLETVTQSQTRANQLFTDLQKFAAQTPFEFPELVRASTNLEAFGLKTEDWIDTIGNTASAMGKSVDQVTQAVLDVQGNQFERLKELGILASVEGDKLKLSYMENGKQITETVDKNNKAIVNSTIQAIWNRKYAGAMKKQSQTFNGQLSTLKDNWNMTMGRLTAGFFDFSKGVLSEANQFFDLFNKKLDQGLDPVHAALSALHVTLDQVFGKEMGDRIDATLRGIVDGIGAVIGAVSGLAGALASGDIAGFFSQLGGIAGSLVDWTLDVAAPTITGWLADHADDAWAGLTAAAGWAWDGLVELGAWTLDTAIPTVTGWLLTAVEDAWNALKFAAGWLLPVAADLGAWTLDTVMPAVTGWLADTAGDAWTAIKTAAGWAFTSATIEEWTLYVNDPSAVDMPDPSGAMTTEVNKKDKESTTALLAKWYLTLQGEPVTDASQEDVEKSITDYFDLNRITATLKDPGAWTLGFESVPIIDMVTDIPTALNESLNAIEPIRGKIDDWDITFSDLFDYNIFSPTGQANFGDWLIGKLGELIGHIDVPLLDWALKLGPPEILAGAIAIDSQITLWINGALGLMDKVTATLLGWGLKLTTPEWPNMGDSLVVVQWIEDQLDSLGSFLTSLADGVFSINVTPPDFPNLTFGNVWSWINSALQALGSFIFSLPISVNVIPQVNMPNIGIPGFQHGGTVNSPLAMVGERGPELVSLPRGSYVHTAAKTAAMLRGGRMGRASGGDTYFLVDLSGAIVGKGAMAELQRMIAEGTARTYDGRASSLRLAGR